MGGRAAGGLAAAGATPDARRSPAGGPHCADVEEPQPAGLSGARRGTIRGAACVGKGASGVVGRSCSIRSLSVGGTTRPGPLPSAEPARPMEQLCSTTLSTAGGALASTTGSTGADGLHDRRRRFDQPVLRRAAEEAAGRTTSTSATGAATGGGLTVLTRRGGGRAGAAGFGGSGAFLAGAPFRPLTTGVSAKMSPDGSEILRCRASRSTNCRATTSSIVLDALFTSMPWSRFSSAVTSWLVVLSSSATLYIRTVANR